MTCDERQKYLVQTEAKDIKRTKKAKTPQS